MTSIGVQNEKTQLLSSLRDNNKETVVSYDSIIANSTTGADGTIVYCSHGNNEKICCKKDGIPVEQPVNWSHCHSMDSSVDAGVDRSARRKLIVASILCLIFMLIEVIGGLLANSLAIATDAAHLLTDFASFMISLFSLWVATRPASSRMSFGWHRAEVIGALTSVLMIWVVTGILCFMAVQRIISKEYEIEADIMLITAAIGVIVNIIMGVSLQIGGVPHGHSHGGVGGGHSHDDHDHHHHHEKDGSHDDDDVENSHKKRQNINVRAAFIHVIGDFFQSLGVLVAALIIYFKPEYGIVDPICTFLFSALVLITTFNIIKDVLNVLMEGKPRGVDFLEVQRTLFDIPGVLKVHNLRIWSLSLDKTALSTHLAIAKGQNPTKILSMASQQIRKQFSIYELTIQVEEYREEMSDCQQCQTPQC
ncbi:proton-coupled zinc antiporter SLC30A2-like [Oppia nitens]|uniref:proton-coupled zinc antiporter SLC30A2-like n=1 Tax=Oppia nitens TaxID=1686743 RepID=UPI0023DCCDB6|nr:proton-coupled zinc antiporter SLC30A2-like [Oppia nitens]